MRAQRVVWTAAAVAVDPAALPTADRGSSRTAASTVERTAETATERTRERAVEANPKPTSARQPTAAVFRGIARFPALRVHERRWRQGRREQAFLGQSRFPLLQRLSLDLPLTLPLALPLPLPLALALTLPLPWA